MEKMKDYIYNKVKACLEEKRMYLDPELSLIKFSKIVGTNTTYLSNVVNRHYGCNFKTLVNGYRIRHAIAVMRQGSMKLENLPMGCGFSSKSAFYEAFKKETGLTPASYRNKYVKHIEKEVT